MFRSKFLVPAVLALTLSAGPVVAADEMVPPTETLIEGLKPKADPGIRTRGFGPGRGVGFEEPAAPPSVDLRILFEFGKADLTETAKAELVKLGRALTSTELTPYRFELGGHTDAVGSDAANQDLSERRAKSVRSYLAATFGIDPARLVAKGYGESRLALPNDPENGKNRRVQITNLGAR
ncbi:MAG: OmpA family protein [Alphaproteobacteria bacterium]|nr:OmpA family protein [Alphaproteobacteria bacterium]